jgi:hypothetical protein
MLTSKKPLDEYWHFRREQIGDRFGRRVHWPI